MPAYYLDTSALVKRYAPEVGTSWILALTDPAGNHELYTVSLTGPEMIAALTRKLRMTSITPDEAAHFIRNFRADWQQRYSRIAANDSLLEQAMILIERHGLRGYDAVHVAAALRVEYQRQNDQLSSLTFVSADREQLTAAQAEGLLVEDPNQYP